MSGCWVPKEHCYDGSCDGQLVLPHYISMPDYVMVYDVALRNSGWNRWQKRLWTRARDAALARWGYPAEVAVRGLNRGDYLPQGITLDRFTTPPNVGVNSYGGFGLAPIDEPWYADYDQVAHAEGKGFALINDVEVNSAFAARVTGRLTGVICHEIGHALGFGHGGTGIMQSSVSPPYYPDAVELFALKDYWGVA